MIREAMRLPLRRFSRTGWLLVSLAVHAAVLLAVFAWLRGGAEEPERREWIEVTLFEDAPAETSEPRSLLRFRRTRAPAVRERIVLPRENVALAPPPPDAVLEPEAAGGGIDVGRDLPSALEGFSFQGRGGGSAGRGVGAGTGTGETGTFQEYIGSLRQTGLDVVFVIDATGSMGWLVTEVKERVRALADSIRRLVPATRFGIVAYRDRDDAEFVTRVQPLTFSVPKLRRFLDRLETRGGGDLPEAVDAGLRAAIEEAGWDAGAKGVIILLGDAPPHADRLDDAVEIARAFRGRGGTVTTVDVSFDANPHIAARQLGKPVEELATISRRGALPELRRIARAGGGEGGTLEGEDRLVRRLAVLIFGSEWAEVLRPMLGDL